MSVTEDDLAAEGFTDASALLAEEVVYALYAEGVCVYVGRSTQVQIRVQQHRAYGRVFDRVLILSSSRDTSLAEEKKWIGLLAPVFVCTQCETKFHASRSDALYCSNACRQQAYRDREQRGLIVYKPATRWLDRRGF